MKDVVVKIFWVDDVAKSCCPYPAYQTPGASGMDVHAFIADERVLKAGEIALIPTGFALEIPQGYEAQIRPRSGLALKHGITLINSPGTIDSDYRGEIKVPLINLGKESFFLKKGERIAQLIIAPVCKATLLEVEGLTSTERGSGGFGHTGK